MFLKIEKNAKINIEIFTFIVEKHAETHFEIMRSISKVEILRKNNEKQRFFTIEN